MAGIPIATFMMEYEVEHWAYDTEQNPVILPTYKSEHNTNTVSFQGHVGSLRTEHNSSHLVARRQCTFL